MKKVGTVIKECLNSMKYIYYTMNEKRLTEREIADIVKMRGLGYSQTEIAKHLKVSQSAVQYQLARIRERAQRDGDDNTFAALLIAAGIGVGIGLLLTKLLEK